MGDTHQGTFEECYATGDITGTTAGGLFGSASIALVTECYATGAVSGTSTVGGLVGYISGTVIESCYATGDISGNSSVGGLVGRSKVPYPIDSNVPVRSGFREVISSRPSVIRSCWATGAVSGGNFAGGLIGENMCDEITVCCATGAVTGELGVGGLIGFNNLVSSSISLCCSMGPVSGIDEVGGLVGRNYGALSQCYATGSISADMDVGGLIGRHYGTVTECYSTGAGTGDLNVGGLVGNNYGAVSASYWDVETSGTVFSPVGEGRSTADLMRGATFVEWDFDTVWDIIEEDTYPWLRSLGISPGEVEQDPCYSEFHSADQDKNYGIELTELMRIIQLFNSGEFHCAGDPPSTEDGYALGPGANYDCCPHDSDNAPAGPDWTIQLMELLRIIQLFNARGYHYCPDRATEDGYCPGLEVIIFAQ
jgi:hypothetical protein